MKVGKILFMVKIDVKKKIKKYYDFLQGFQLRIFFLYAQKSIAILVVEFNLIFFSSYY